MAGHESAELDLVSRAGFRIWLDIQSRDPVEIDRFGRYARRYAAPPNSLAERRVHNHLCVRDREVLVEDVVRVIAPLELAEPDQCLAGEGVVHALGVPIGLEAR